MQKPSGSHSERSLHDLNYEINKNSVDLREVKNPSLGQLVLAPYIDQLYYRAKIVELAEDGFEVFYVDYGNRAYVPFDGIRIWEDCFDDLPFQAVKFIIGTIEIENSQNYLQGLSCFTNKILNKKFNALVM